jgi:hypothetical protein
MEPVKEYTKTDSIEDGIHNPSKEQKITKHMEPNYARKKQEETSTNEHETGFYIKNTKTTRSLSSNKRKTRREKRAKSI